MPGTTSALGLPYAVDTDARAAGAGAIQDLAEATESRLLNIRPKWLNAAGGSGSWGGANTWVNLTYAAATADGFESGDAVTYTYTGGPRAAFVGLGAIVAATSGTSPSSKALRLFHNGVEVKRTEGVAERAGLHLSHVVVLNTGDTLGASIYEGTFTAAWSHAYLCVMSGPNVS